MLAEIDSVGALGKRMAFGVGTFDDDAESCGDARLLAAFFPKVGDGLLEGQTDAGFAFGVGVEIDNADFLLLAAALVHEKNGVAEKEFGFQGDEGAAGIDDDGFGVFMEGTGFASKTVNDDRYAHGDALTGAEYFLCRDGGEGNGKRWLVFLGWSGIAEGCYLDDFLCDSLLRALLAALKFPRFLKDLFERFLAVRKTHPRAPFPPSPPHPHAQLPRHVSSPRL